MNNKIISLYITDEIFVIEFWKNIVSIFIGEQNKRLKLK